MSGPGGSVAPSERPAPGSTARTFAAFMLAAAAAGLSLNVAPISVVAVAKEFAIDSALAGWVVTATLLATAAWLPIAGGLTRRFSSESIITVSMMMSALGGILVVVGGAFWIVVSGRALLGLSLVCVSISIAVMRRELLRPLAIRGAALVSTTFAAGSAVAAPIAGAIQDAFGWRYVSIVLIVLLIGGIALSPRTRGSRAIGDRLGVRWITSALVWAIAVSAFLIGLSRLEAPTPAGLVLTLGSLIIVATLLMAPARSPLALLDSRVSRGSAIVLVNTTSALVGFVTFCFTVFMALRVVSRIDEGGFGLSYTTGALVVAPMSVAMVLSTRLSSVLLRRHSEHALILIGLAGTAAGSAWLALSGRSIAEVVMIGFMIGMGAGFSFVGMPLAAIAVVPAAVSSQAATVNGLSQVLGSSTAAVVVALTLQFTAFYSQQILGTLMTVCSLVAAALIIRLIRKGPHSPATLTPSV